MKEISIKVSYRNWSDEPNRSQTNSWLEKKFLPFSPNWHQMM